MKTNFIIILTTLTIFGFIFLTCTDEPPTAPNRTNPLDENNPETNGDPFNLTAQISGGGIQLNWDTVGLENVIGYNIHRGIDDDGFSMNYEVDGRNTSSFTDTGIVNGHKYSYYIVTRNTQGKESTSNIAEVEINNTPLLSIDQGDYTTVRIIDLTLLAFSAVSMQIGTPNLNGAEWVTYSTTADIELETGPGTKTVQARFVYNDGDTSEVVSDDILPQQMNPNMVIANDSIYTATREVELSLSAEGVLWMNIWNDTTSANSNSRLGLITLSKSISGKKIESIPDNWIPYSSSYTWELLEGEGAKTVFVEFKNDFGIVESDSDSIEPLPMDVTFVIAHDSTYTETRDVWLFPSFQGSNLMCKFSEDSTFTEINWGSLLDSVQFTLSTGVGSKTVYAKYKNNFEIESPTLSDTISYFHCYEPSNLILQTNETSITLNWQDNSNVEQGYKIERKISGGSYSQITTVGANVETYTDNNLTIGAVYFYRVRAYNSSGNSGYSNEAQIYLIITFSNTFGGSGDDKGHSVQQTMDGGYIIAGTTSSFGAGANDFYLVKTDDNGNQQWYQTFGGSDDEWGDDVQQTTDGGYIIVGWTYSFSVGFREVYLIKTDGNGNQQWQQTFGGNSMDYGRGIQQTMDGGYIIAGTTSSFGAGANDFYLIKTDDNGNQQWYQTFGGSDNEWGADVQQTTDGGYIMVGTTSSIGAGDTDVYLIKTNNQGNAIWSKTFGGGDDDWGVNVQQSIDSGYIITGFTVSFGAGYCDVYLIKTDNQGNEIWSKTFGGIGDDRGNGVQQTTDGGFIIVGSTESNGSGCRDIYLIKTDNQGNEIWSKTFGGSDNEWGESVEQTADDGYVIAGYTESNGSGSYEVWLIKTDMAGNVNQ